ncbi:MAG: hypothetical protein JXA95_10930 [Spirochaetales bacterium]|nr:hypothetical protein [Spirochaetales bacterium]
MLSNSQMKKAQANYTRFTMFNVLSYSFMAGNVVLLYALRLGAGTRLVGILTAFNSITFTFSLLGRRIIPRIGYVKNMGYFWLFRYLIMLPVLLTLIPSFRDNPLFSLGAICVGILGFNVLKGIALASTNPILGFITREESRASYLATNNMINFTGQIITGILIALLLGEAAPLYKYPLFIGIGILAGLFAALSLLRLPEQERPARTENTLFLSMKEALKREGFPRFITLVVFSTLATSMGGGFLILYGKRVYLQADGVIIFFTVAGALGSLVMARFAKFVTDRVGSKPMYFTFHILQILCFIPIMISPALSPSSGLMLFLCLLFFFNQMMTWGIGYSADIYFFSITREEDRLDFSVIYNIIRGLAGMLGSLGGGFLLSALETRFQGNAPSLAFRFYYAAPALILLTNTFLITRLPDKGKYSITDVLGIIFNPRDLKAIYYLNKLDRTTSSEDEREIVSTMGSSKSPLYLEELYNRLNSPSFFVRAEALNSIKQYPLTGETESYLIRDLEEHPYTTAHISADILGELGAMKAVKPLVRALDSPDYLLVSKAAVALGKLEAREYGYRIMEKLRTSDNPRIIMFCARAMELLKQQEALPVLLSYVETKTYPHLTDDLIMNSAALMDFGDWFYPFFITYLDKPHKGIGALSREIDEWPWKEELFHLLKNREGGDFYSRALEILRQQGGDDRVSSLIGENLTCHGGMIPPRKTHFLLCGYLIHRSGKSAQSHVQ